MTDETSPTTSGFLQPIAEDEGAISSHRVKIFIALAVLLGAFGYLAFMAIQSATVYYYTVGELLDIGPAEDGRMVRVNGKLVQGSFEREEDSTVARFTVTDGEVTLSVVHDGVVPGLFFNEHSEIILEGNYTPDGIFKTGNVPIVKCPSKYIAAN